MNVQNPQRFAPCNGSMGPAPSDAWKVSLPFPAAERRDMPFVDSEPRPRVVEARDLGRRFGSTWALAHVDLVVPRGQTVLLMGANGSGKTTLLRLLAGIYRATTGSLSVLGRALPAERMECRRHLSLVDHESYLYGRLTALETLRMWARFLGKQPSESALLELLAEVGLAEQRNAPADGFSAGMRKRLSLARTRLEQPQLLLLDEPMSALDGDGRRIVSSWIEECQQNGHTILMASHDIERVAPMCNRAVLLRQGQVAWDGKATEVVGNRVVGG